MNKLLQLPNLLAVLAGFALSCGVSEPVETGTTDGPPSFSGIYPHLAYYNNENECGTGAVVPWAGDLWVITYGPHLPNGSSDKLYQITPDLEQIVRDESLGGTPANRMIHKESDQLFIGPYAISAAGEVRSIPYTEMSGRHTGNARHLTDPANKIYYGTMEEGFYEVDVHTLAVNMLYEDGNTKHDKGEDTSENQPTALLDGAHGKGLYSGQGVLVYSNNGESGQLAQKQFDIPAGSLSEWDGDNWKLVRRNQFVEVTGPGGIYGNENPETDPIWTTGWDHKSVLLGVRDGGSWSFFRLPKASHSYDGAHGWNTEWPRIRDIGTPQDPDYLMTMHGMFWDFPGDFRSDQTAGIRPRSAYLKVIGDFTRWEDRLVFGCDDSAKAEFLNKRKAKGKIQGAGQSNSNLWFTSMEQPDHLGPNTAEGAVWLNESVAANTASEPFLFAGWPDRTAWIHNAGSEAVTFTFEADRDGNGQWSELSRVEVAPGASVPSAFAADTPGEWIRVKTDRSTQATVHFFYGDADTRETEPDAIFSGITPVRSTRTVGGLLHELGDNRRTLGVAATHFEGGAASPKGYYELDGNMNLQRRDDAEMETFIRENYTIPKGVISIEASSVLVVDDKGRRWRLPLGNAAYKDLTDAGALRIAREVATERDLFSCSGTFYELPAENADGFAKIRPVSSHNFRVHDYASYRGMLILTGVDPAKAADNPHIVASEDGQAAVWAGVIDDLWKLGKPVGEGGPWKDSAVKYGEVSDPYLIGFYDEKTLTLEHDQAEAVSFTIEAEPVGHGPWMTVETLSVPAGEKLEYQFPEGFQARWIRFKTDKDCTATTWLVYR
ncbi:hypothetical protein [Flavilitoribacter nigricans]|uniref:Uncharacterized protein n=1 Tax=Flavilitoribacter nigricans (strain ATCC 23147 / DSM 23189 / NBRC 102662 / NCIMB 1420 / SS-2) TaxID=1122177 RepID=A0A2D0NC82_FLAN2|nr:hypothetical protein [Flavilitoribacter nigricans]PHN06097.1 hypothetical protein CRP01_14100 [Flavilitoribacter nigricans DSM 23189 = NBRC 102662]